MIKNHVKTTTLTLRMKRSLKNALCTAAIREHRSITNMVEVLIIDYCKRNKIDIKRNRNKTKGN